MDSLVGTHRSSRLTAARASVSVTDDDSSMLARPMLDQPLLAHPAEWMRVREGLRSCYSNDHGRYDQSADDNQHV